MPTGLPRGDQTTANSREENCRCQRGSGHSHPGAEVPSVWVVAGLSDSRLHGRMALEIAQFQLGDFLFQPSSRSVVGCSSEGWSVVDG